MSKKKNKRKEEKKIDKNVDMDTTVEVDAEEFAKDFEKKNIESEKANSDSKEEVDVKIVEEISPEDLLAEQKDKFARLMAEFDNYKRRSAKEYERLISLANRGLMLDIIEVRDNFERAIGMADEKHDFSEFLKGMEMVFTKLDENLTKNGLSVFTEEGDEFNPELHDAMLQSPSEDIEKGKILQIYEKGYKLKDSVIKHAKVIVSSGAPEDADDEKDK